MHGKRLWLTALALLALVPFLATNTLAKKGGNKPPPDSPADPAITFHTDRGVWVMNDDGSHQTLVYENTSAAIYSPTWSGDGGSISFVEDEDNNSGVGVLLRIDVEVVDGVPVGSEPVTVVDDGEVWFAEWSPTDDVIAYFAQPTTWEDRELRIVSSDGGDPETLYTATTGDGIEDLSWSPDGTRIAIIETEDFIAAHVRVIDVDTGGVTTVDLPLDDRHWRFGGDISWARTQDVLAYTEKIKKVSVKGKKVTITFAWRIHLLDLATGDGWDLTGGYRPTWSPDDAFLVWDGGQGLRNYEFASETKEDLTGFGMRPDWR